MGAAYGRADVTNSLNQRVTQGQSLQVQASNSVFGDSWPGVRKTLVVVYQHEGYDPRVAVVREHNTLYINSRTRGFNQPPYTPGSTLKIVGAAYGLADVTHKVQSSIHNNRLDITASNGVFGDSYCGIKKTLVIVYQHGSGPYRTEIATEGYTLHIV